MNLPVSTRKKVETRKIKHSIVSALYYNRKNSRESLVWLQTRSFYLPRQHRLASNPLLVWRRFLTFQVRLQKVRLHRSWVKTSRNFSLVCKQIISLCFNCSFLAALPSLSHPPPFFLCLVVLPRFPESTVYACTNSFVGDLSYYERLCFITELICPSGGRKLFCAELFVPGGLLTCLLVLSPANVFALMASR